MNINEIISGGVEMNITFKASDLREFAEHLVRQTVKELAGSVAKTDTDYLTVDEVAEMLHVHRVTLWKWNKSGYLKHVELGSKRLYRKSDVYELLKNTNGHE